MCGVNYNSTINIINLSFFSSCVVYFNFVLFTFGKILYQVREGEKERYSILSSFFLKIFFTLFFIYGIVAAFYR